MTLTSSGEEGGGGEGWGNGPTLKRTAAHRTKMISLARFNKEVPVPGVLGLPPLVLAIVQEVQGPVIWCPYSCKKNSEINKVLTIPRVKSLDIFEALICKSVSFLNI
jgi:hypothetical protein